jgi:hypothetical protein
MFQFPRLPPLPYVFRQQRQRFSLAGFPIRTSTALCSLTAPRGISVFAPSFVGSWRLGILHALFLTSPSGFRLTSHFFVSFVSSLPHVRPCTLSHSSTHFLELLVTLCH